MSRKTSPGIIVLGLVVVAIIVYAFTSSSNKSTTSSTSGSGDTEIAMKTVFKDADLQQNQKQNLVIKSADEWKNKLGKDAPSTINFDDSMVIAVFAGQRTSGGNDIEIKKIVDHDNNIEVDVEETSPGSSCITTSVINYPSHIVTIPQSDKEVKFNTSETVKECN
jgi:hypothetical protein